MKKILLFLITVGLVTTIYFVRAANQESKLEVATLAPQTGAAAELGRFNVNAAQMALNEINAGSKQSWQLLIEDSKSNPKDAVQAVEAIWAKGSPKVIMTHQGSVSVATAPIIAVKKAVMLYIGATEAPKGVHPLAFRIYPDSAYVARKTVEQIILPTKAKKMALFYVNDDFGVTVAKAFREKAVASSLDLTFDESYNASTSDFRQTLGKLQSSGTQVLYVVGVGAPLGRVLAQAREVGFRGRIVGGPEMQFSDVLTQAGSAAEGAQFLDLTFDPASPNEPVKSFVSKYVAEFGSRPSAASALVYDAWMSVSQAVAASGATTPEAIAAALISLGYHDGVCGHVQITSERDFVYPLIPKVIQGGKPVSPQ